MTTVAITGLVLGFCLGVLVAHEARKVRLALGRKMRRLFR
jgi:hypothetical protein